VPINHQGILTEDSVSGCPDFLGMKIVKLIYAEAISKPKIKRELFFKRTPFLIVLIQKLITLC
jgi:hypothetical protein